MLETGDLAELTVARSLLESEGIACVVLGEEGVRLGPMRALNPFLAHRRPAASLQVGADDAEVARELLRELAIEPETD